MLVVWDLFSAGLLELSFRLVLHFHSLEAERNRVKHLGKVQTIYEDGKTSLADHFFA